MERIKSQLDEIDAMLSILCANGEMVIRTPQRLAVLRSLADRHHEQGHEELPIVGCIDDSPLVLELNLHTNPPSLYGDNNPLSSFPPKGPLVQLVITLPSSYPDELPTICVTSSKAMNRASCERLKTSLLDECAVHLGQSMLLGLVQHILSVGHQYLDSPGRQPEVSQSLSSAASKAEEGRDCRLAYCLIQIDHMHARSAYCKTIKAWCRELGIHGRVIFQGRLILLLLEAAGKDSLITYLCWHRTRPVDVDTAGRTCKEHCMTVLLDPTCLVADDDDDGGGVVIAKSQSTGVRKR